VIVSATKSFGSKKPQSSDWGFCRFGAMNLRKLRNLRKILLVFFLSKIDRFQNLYILKNIKH